MTLIYIALGGAVGSVLRYVAGSAVQRAMGSGFAYGTLCVNVAGSLAMGLLIGWLAKHPHHSTALHPLLAMGVLGGFTTFSAFSLDAVQLWQRGDMVPAMVYVTASVLISLGALVIGLMLMQGKAL